MEVKVVAVTKEVEEPVKTLRDDFNKFAGKAAGVCYMPDDYLSEGIQDEEKALKRAFSTAGNGHHSVFDHCHLTMVVKTSKMMAMVLNSIGVYNTSEKSARYTKMKPDTQLELDMYTKWIGILRKEILNKYPDMDDELLSKRLCKRMGIEYDKDAVINGSFGHIKDDEYVEEELNSLKNSETLPSYKLAQENARYMLSVFTPTTMMYTVSDRQLALVIEHLRTLVKDTEDLDDNFNKKLRADAEELATELSKVFSSESPVHDNKNQKFRFLEFQSYRMDNVKKEVIGDSYTITGEVSLACLAQMQRHRSVRYTMMLPKAGEFGYYVPEIIKDKPELTNMWLKDIKEVEYCTPQGTIVKYTEQGLFEDFALKCKERLCGRAQLEIAKETAEKLKTFASSNHKGVLSKYNEELIDSMTHGCSPLARCAFKDFTCTEGCRWRANEALTRQI